MSCLVYFFFHSSCQFSVRKNFIHRDTKQMFGFIRKALKQNFICLGVKTFYFDKCSLNWGNLFSSRAILCGRLRAVFRVCLQGKFNESSKSWIFARKLKRRSRSYKWHWHQLASRQYLFRWKRKAESLAKKHFSGKLFPRSKIAS